MVYSRQTPCDGRSELSLFSSIDICHLLLLLLLLRTYFLAFFLHTFAPFCVRFMCLVDMHTYFLLLSLSLRCSLPQLPHKQFTCTEPPPSSPAQHVRPPGLLLVFPSGTVFRTLSTIQTPPKLLIGACKRYFCWHDTSAPSASEEAVVRR